MEYSVSANEENYHGPYSTLEEAVAVGMVYGHKFYVGENRPPEKAETYWDSESFFEHVSEQDEYSLECAEDWDDSNKEQRAELDSLVRAVICEWFERHNLRPKFWHVENVKAFDKDGKPIN